MTRRIWTNEQIEYLKKNHNNPDITVSDMSKVINVPKSTLTSKLNELNLKEAYDKAHNIGWTKKQEQYLTENSNTKTLREMAADLSMSPSAVSVKIGRMGLSTKYKDKHYWTDEDVEFLKANYGKMTVKEIGKVLKRSVSSVEGEITRQGIERISLKNKNWSEEEVAFLKENFEHIDYVEMSKEIDRSVRAIGNKAHELGLTINHVNRSKLKKTQIQFILDNYLQYTDNQMAAMFHVSDRAIAAVRVENGLKKVGNEVTGSSYIEIAVMSLLDKLGIEYQYNVTIGEYRPDFYIKESKLLIEVQGDYFHCNPRLYGEGPGDDIQTRHVLRDYYKKCYYLSRGYKILELWEHDIVRHIDVIEQKIMAAVSG